MIQLWDVAGQGDYALAVHGGAGGRIAELSHERRIAFETALSRAYEAGAQILADGGAALDAVCAAVVVLEDEPLFNAGRGAALTADGTAELDAAVMAGGRAGAVAGSRYARNPVLLARAVMERTSHVLLMSPPASLVASWDLSTVDPSYFVTHARQEELARLLSEHRTASPNGTVGAVARDRSAAVAAATSTGGYSGKPVGRVGDSPIIGAGTYARDGLLAISCTGNGEAFIRGVVSHEIAARVRYAGLPLADAVQGTVADELTAQNATGGMVCVDASGRVVVAHNSPMMFAAFRSEGGLVTLT